MKNRPRGLKEKKRELKNAMGGLAGALAVLILAVFTFSIVDHYLLGSSSLASVISGVLVDLTNGDRQANSIGGLKLSPVLTAAAQAKADDMAAKGYFSHVSPEGKDSWYWFKLENYRFLYAGENLAVDFSDSADVERAWMNSPTHRANILDGHFTEIGIATAQGTYEGHPTTFVVQMFGTPAELGSSPSPVRALSTGTEPTKPALATTEPAPLTKAKAAPQKVATTAASAAAVLGQEAGSITAPAASWWQYVIASPRTMLQNAFIILAAAIIGLVAFVTELEFHRKHAHHYHAALMLVVLMVVLFIFAGMVIFAEPVIAAL